MGGSGQFYPAFFNLAAKSTPFAGVKYIFMAPGFKAQSHHPSLLCTAGLTQVTAAAQIPGPGLPLALACDGDCDKRAFDCVYQSLRSPSWLFAEQ